MGYNPSRNVRGFLYICCMSYSRKCPNCKSKINYGSKLTYKRAKLKKTLCGACTNYYKNPFPFTKSEFCDLYYNQNLTVSNILIKFNYETHTIQSNGTTTISYRIFKRFKLPKRNEIVKLRKKRFVTKYYNTCPITGENSDYLVDGDYNKAYRNLVDRFKNGNFMRLGSSMKANSPNLTVNQLRLRYLLEKHTTKTICCQCVNIKEKNEMAITKDRPRTCIECVLPKERKDAKEYARKKRKSLGNEKYNEIQREYRKNLSPEKKYELYKKTQQWKSNKPNWGNKPMSQEEVICRRLLHLTIRALDTNKTTSTYVELGYTPQEFLNVVGDKQINCDLDHKIPISWFKKHTPFSIVNSLDNLQWVDSKYNRAKQNFWFDNISSDFFNVIKQHIKENKLSRFVVDSEIVYDVSYGEYKPDYVVE
jgi:hypothetical protein